MSASKKDADGAAFAQVINRLQANSAKSDKDFKMTKEEGERLLEAFKKPEFRQMFKEYVDEISDPKNREEYEAHLKQMEADSMVPEDKELMKPKAGFCIKTKTQDGNKVFINICHHERVEEPTVQSSAKGQQWSLPNTLGPPRMEKDNRGTPCVTFDLAFHSKALSMAARNKPFKNMLCEVAIEQVQAKYRQYQRSDTVINKKYHILKKVACIGGSPAIMTLSKKKQKKTEPATAPAAKGGKASASAGSQQSAVAPAAGSQAESKAEGKQDGSTAATSRSAKRGKSRKSKPAARATKGEAQPGAAIQETLPAGVVVPQFKIVHRGEFDMGGFGTSRESSAIKRPKELVVKVELPALKSVRGVELDVSERELSLVKPGKYQLKLRLPYPVVDARAGARFVKDKRRLVVTIPVKAPPKPAPKPFVEPTPEATEDADKAGAGEAKPPVVPSRSTDQSRWVSGSIPKPPPLPVPVPEASEAVASTPSASSPAAAAASPVTTCACPSVTWRESPTKVTILVPIVGVASKSAELRCTSAREVRVSLRVPAKSTRYEFVLQCTGDVDVSAARLDVSSDNVVLLLSKSTPGLWQSFGSIRDVPQGTESAAGPPAAAADGAGARAGTGAGESAGAGAGAGAGAEESKGGSAAQADYIPAASFQGAKPGYYFGRAARGLGYYLDPVQQRAKALPAVRRSARVVTHATGKPSAASAQPKRPHPLTGAPELSQPGAAAATSSDDRSHAAAADLSAVNLTNTAIFEID